MVIAHHLIFTGYGWWLPNDPRGSSSCEIRCDVIAELGELHHGRRKVQPASRDIRRFYEDARAVLKHELSEFTPRERAMIAECFEAVIRRCDYTCYACVIMPDHVHLLVRKHRDHAETMIEHLQTVSRSRLHADGLRSETHPIWGGPGWKVFLDEPEDVRRTIAYIENNPRKIGLPAQRYPFVTPYDNWPFHKR